MKKKLASARFGLQLCALSAALSLTAGAAMAQTETEKNPPRAKDTPAAAAKAATVAVAPNARLVALVQSRGTLIRQKGVQQFIRAKPGIYCLRPTAASGINPLNSIVVVSPEFFYSELTEVQVQWASRGSVCGNDRIAIYTMADVNLDGRYTFSDLVGFSVIVP